MVSPMRSVSTPEIDAATADAFRGGDRDAFARISRHHFRELHIHCYRMLGSFDEADDVVQETFLRAWRKRATFEGRATLRAWLYRIATNACIDALRRRTPEPATHDDADDPAYARRPWMQPYPDTLLDTAGSGAQAPDSDAIARETIELAFLAAIQALPPKQRAVLILREVLDFSANETAAILDDTPAAVNSALQRARAMVRHRRKETATRSAPAHPTFDEAVLLQLFMDAITRLDVDAMVGLLREDVRMTLLPAGSTWKGCDDVARELLARRTDFGDAKVIPIAANRQPAVAVYRRHQGDTAYRAWGISVLGVVDGKVREIATFASPELFARFDLAPTIP
jgi:RNA polymerase sigma-70 factor (ECF subfamily)